LGTFGVTTGGRSVTAWRAGGAKAAFQLLLANRGRTLSREHLRSVLWPERADDRLGNSLSVALHAVRRIVHCGRDLVLEQHGDGYRLRIRDGGRLWVDVEEVAALAEAARLGNTGDAITAADRVAALYGGEFLPLESADWIVAQRVWATSVAVSAIHAARAAALTVGRWDDALRMCGHALRIDPCDESSYQALMWLHGRTNERSRVASWYGLCSERLAQALGVEPAPLTQQLFADGIRCRRATEVPAALLVAC